MNGKIKECLNPDYEEYVCNCGDRPINGIRRRKKDKNWHIHTFNAVKWAAKKILFCPYCGDLIEGVESFSALKNVDQTESRLDCKFSVKNVCQKDGFIKCSGGVNDKLGCPEWNIRVLK